MAAFSVILFFAAIFSFVLFWTFKYLKLQSRVNKIKGPRAYPIIGNALQLRSEPDDFWDQLCGVCLMYKDRPRIMRYWLLWAPYVLVYGAEEAETILSSNKFNNKSYDYTLLHPWMGLGLLTSPTEKWRPRRKLLTPTFHYDILKDFVHVFNEQSRVLVKNLQLISGKRDVDLYQYITLCTLDIICQSAMGRHINAQQNKTSDYVRAIYRLNYIIHQRQRKPWFWNDFLFNTLGDGKEHDWCLKVVHGFSEKVIEERYKELQQHTDTNSEPKKRMPFLDLLLEMVNNGSLTMQDVREEVDTFMFEGHDTTSAGMIWALHLIGNHPECQAKIHREIDEVFGVDDDRDITSEDLKNLHYLEMCAKESLRLCPSVALFGRTVTEDCGVGDLTIPPGTQLLFFPHGVHRDPKHWPDPDVFNPDRFLPENSVGRHPFAFLPFSAASRNCIGQRFALLEEKTVMAWIFRYFKIRSCQRVDEIRPKAEMIFRPCEEIRMGFKLRRRPMQV